MRYLLVFQRVLCLRCARNFDHRSLNPLKLCLSNFFCKFGLVQGVLKLCLFSFILELRLDLLFDLECFMIGQFLISYLFQCFLIEALSIFAPNLSLENLQIRLISFLRLCHIFRQV